jgi:type I restriction enzyme S subunit
MTIAELASPAPHALSTGPFGSAISSKHFVDEGVPVLRGSNLSLDVGVRLRDEGLAFLDRAKADTFQRSAARRGDLVFTCWGTVGQVGLVDERSKFGEYIVSNKQMKLTPDPTKVDSHFLYYLLSSPEMIQAVQGQAIGAAVPGFNLGQLRELRVTIPPIELQRAIVGVLCALDNLIENNRRRVEVLEEMARAIYREWFVHLRYPDHEDVPLVDSPLGPIPQAWVVRAIGELAHIDKGLSYKGAHLVDTGTPMANLKCLLPGGGFRRDGAKPYDGPFKPKHQVSAGDLVMANTDLTQAGSVIGSPAFIPRSGFEEGGIASHHLFIVRPTDGGGRRWLYGTFRDDRFRSYARGVASGTTVLGFRPADLAAYQVVVPPPDLMARFEETAGAIADLQENLAELMEVLVAKRDLLLPKLVTGQIDVSHLDLDALTEAAIA